MNKTILFLKNLIFKGQVPFFKIIKIILSLVPILALTTFIDPQLNRDFANYGWTFLIITMISRPIATIFPRLGILRKFVLLRRQLGIIAGTFILAHGVPYLLAGQPSIAALIDPQFWDFKMFLTWGILGIIASLIPLITSNNFTMRYLGKWWKPIQRLSYLFFIFGGIHIFLVRGNLQIIIEIAIWGLVWILAHFKVIIWKEKKTS